MSYPEGVLFAVEGPTDAALLKLLLRPPAGVRFRYFDGGGLSLASLGRNLLVHKGAPVVVVMDADTRNGSKVDEAVGLTRFLLRNVAPEESFAVFAFVPGIEVVFFEAPHALARLLGRPLTDGDVREGLLGPKETLVRLLAAGDGPRAEAALIAAITPELAAEFAAGTQAAGLRDAVERLLAVSAAA